MQPKCARTVEALAWLISRLIEKEKQKQGKAQSIRGYVKRDGILLK
jgi:hypothetical protein